jgi:hypothetical protein
MMSQQQHAAGRQIDLLALAHSNPRLERLDRTVHAEITSLLKLLLNESLAAFANTPEAVDE